MTENLLLQQYGKFKRIELEKSPYRFLLNTNIEYNPHQINAFCAAIDSLKTGGIILADEVGLGKTIEAGLVLKYVLDSGAKRVLIVLPNALRKQWEIELDEKFNIKAIILDRLIVEKDYYNYKSWIERQSETRVIITSYDYSSKLIKRFPSVKWDFIIIDEAHNLRNVFHGTKRAKNLYDVTSGIPKVLLTATPIQNSLKDLHGLISFIDPRIFGSEKEFTRKYIVGEDYYNLKKDIKPVLYRTLRKDVGKYMVFSKRQCITVDFELTADEKRLYDLVNSFLKCDNLYSIPTANKSLIILVIRKLLASSSVALIETFEVLKARLEKLYQGTKSSDAQDGFDLFWDFVEDEIDEQDLEIEKDPETVQYKQQIQDELSIVNEILEVASSIKTNAKISAVKEALSTAFNFQKSEGLQQKAVIFTESKRTQKYIADELKKAGYDESDIVLFNGEMNDPITKEIYRTWQVKNFGKTNYGRNVEYKHAIVDYFKNNGKVLIVTDAGSEGLNLQFCFIVINYDLPWNPQKIEQRIGRCHRYGQTHDVVALNLLNTGNEADSRVYEILSKKFELFDGVFGASDIALGALETGTSFEKKVLEIYQKCNSVSDFDKAFNKLNKQLDDNSNKQASQLRTLLLTESPEAKEEALDSTKTQIERYLSDIVFWNDVSEPVVDNKLYYWNIDNWGEKILGFHGFLYLGAFYDNNKLLFPVLLLCDRSGKSIEIKETKMVDALKKAKDEDVTFFFPTKVEEQRFAIFYDQLLKQTIEKYYASVQPITDYNKLKVENWISIQEEQFHLRIRELSQEIEELLMEEMNVRDTLHKSDIRKKAGEKKKALEKLQKNLPKDIDKLRSDAEKIIIDFNKQFEINPVLLINIILRF